MKIQYIKQLLFICSVVITSSIYAQEFQQLNIQTQLAKQCHQDDEDIFSPQTYQLRSTKVEPYRVCRRLNILRDYSDEKTKLYPRN